MMHSRNTFGEVLIVIVALIGSVFLSYNGIEIALGDYVQMLGVMVGLYAALLFVRVLFSFMAGNDSFWWEKYENHQTKKK